MTSTIRSDALRLRLQGKSYSEIQKELKVAKSTLSSWFRDLVLSKQAHNRLLKRERTAGLTSLIKRNKLQTHLARQRAAVSFSQGKSGITGLSHKDLIIVGATLYWAEGYKRLMVRNGREITSHIIGFVNADPKMISIFILFLKNILNIRDEKIRVTMRLYPHINEELALGYWMKVTGLSRSHFQKTSFLISAASRGKRPQHRLPYGTVHVSVHDTSKFHYLLGLIAGVKNSLENVKISQLPR